MGRRWAGHLPRNHGDGKNAAITANIPGRRPSDSGPSGEGKEGDAKPPPGGSGTFLARLILALATRPLPLTP